MKIISVVGARPQFIKAAMFLKECYENDLFSKYFQVVNVHTGQHYDANMSRIFFDELSMAEPDYQLNIRASLHGEQTGRMLMALESVFIDEKPDIIVVYGDTNSTLAAAIAAAKLHIPIAHIEAGVRSFNRLMPEEINRCLTDNLSSFLFAPSSVAVNNLIKEGCAREKIFTVGDIMYDAILYFCSKIKPEDLDLEKLGIQRSKYIVATIHRPENTDSPEILSNIFNALIGFSEDFPVIIPLHPRTKKELQRIGLFDRVVSQLNVIEPVGYLDMLNLVKQSALVVTDSGGLQKEAFYLGTQCVTLRTETEWVELLDLKVNRIVSPNDKGIIQHLQAAIQSEVVFDEQPYGQGDTRIKILDILKAWG